ncbi:hypothetical protein ACWGR4_30445 [Embleya sp. NPDC055664]
MTAATPPGDPGPIVVPTSPQQESVQAPRVYRDLPAAEQAEVWERVVPGAGDRVLRLVERDFERQAEEHRQWCLDQIHRRRMDLAQLVMRAVVGSGGLAGYLWLAKYFVDHDAAVPAAAMLGGGVAALAALVLRARPEKP